MTYLYCLVRGSRKPVLRRAGGGLPGAGPVRPLDAGEGLWLIVADVKEAEYGEASIASRLQDLEWVSRVNREIQAFFREWNEVEDGDPERGFIDISKNPYLFGLNEALTVDMTEVRARGTANTLRIMGNRLGQFVLPFGAGLIAAATGLSALFAVLVAAIAVAGAAMRWKRPVKPTAE